MFSGLRLRLTLLYWAAALLLIALVGGGQYASVHAQIEGSVDAVLQHALVHELDARGLPVPPEMRAADQAWAAQRGATFLPDDAVAAPEDYDGDLVAVFVLPVTAAGQLLVEGAAAAPPIVPDPPAVAAALAQGSDWRSIRLPSGTRVRLLTYRLPDGAGPVALQVGRSIITQDRILELMLLALAGLGSFAAGLVAAGSWWLAGHSLGPAQQAWSRQQAFIANASHELRTPLTLIRAGAEVARRGLPAGDDRRALLDDVLQECDHMRRLVEDLLLLTRLDAGGLALEARAVDVAELLADVQRQMGRVADERGLRLTAGSADVAVLADPLRLRQVLLILLDNAVRHTPAGGSIRLEGERQGRQVRLSVADTGSGIPPAALPHVFDRFYRADPARGAGGGGSGLGLSIAKGLVEAQQGHIIIESTLGVGTRVTVALPAAPAGRSQPQATPDTDGKTGAPAETAQPNRGR
jgi:signal transduction histidine kinase